MKKPKNKIFKISIPTILFFLFSNHCLAQQAGYFFEYGIGSSRLDFDERFSPEGGAETAINLGVGLGYLFENNVLLQTNFNYAENFSVGGGFDRYTLNELDALVGYQFKKNRWRITPLAGIARWKVSFKEGQIFSPGPEERGNESDSDFIWGLSVNYLMTPNKTLGLTHKSIKTDFGRLSLTSLNVSAHF